MVMEIPEMRLGWLESEAAGVRDDKAEVSMVGVDVGVTVYESMVSMGADCCDAIKKEV